MNDRVENRDGFTLIEMLVAMSIIVLLAGMLIAFLPSAQDQQRAARGATLLQGYLGIAKQTAFRNRVPHGLRFINKAGNLLITELQYLEQPDDFTDKSTAPFNLLSTSSSGNALQMDVNTDLWNGMGPGDQPLWTVQPGDNLEIMGGGLVHRINGVFSNGSASTVLLASSPDPFAPSYTVQIQDSDRGPPTGGQFLLTIRVTPPAGAPVSRQAAIPFNADRAAVQALVSAQLAALYPAAGISPPASATVGGPNNGPWRIVVAIPALTSLIELKVLPGDDNGLVYSYPTPPAVNFPNGKVTFSGPSARQNFPYYRIIRQPRVVGEETLSLPSNIAVDLNTNVSYGNFLPLNGNGDLDVMFAPSGAVVTKGLSQEFIGLWVRDTTTTTVFEGSPTIIAVHVRTGLIAAHPANDAGTDPYSFVKDGRVQ